MQNYQRAYTRFHLERSTTRNGYIQFEEHKKRPSYRTLLLQSSFQCTVIHVTFIARTPDAVSRQTLLRNGMIFRWRRCRAVRTVAAPDLCSNRTRFCGANAICRRLARGWWCWYPSSRRQVERRGNCNPRILLGFVHWPRKNTTGDGRGVGGTNSFFSGVRDQLIQEEHTGYRASPLVHTADKSKTGGYAEKN